MDAGAAGARAMDPDSRTGPAAGQPAAVLRPGAGAGRRGPVQGTEILIEDTGWRRLVPRAEQLAARAAALAGGVGEPVGSVLLTSDRSLRRLNARHRGRNKPTNVLTFAEGDLALALGVVRREARAAGRRPAHHLAHLVVHGALHLHGADHHRAGDARRMEMQEARLLKRLGVPNPWKGS